MEVWRRTLELPEEEAGGIVRFLAAFNLAYQGFPWQPTPEYVEGSPLSGRRYGGLAYPSWPEMNAYSRSLPMGTALSFHLNETPKCPYVSGLLRGDPNMLRLVVTLVKQYNARHIQVNLTAHGVPASLYDGASQESETSAGILHKLCADFPDTIFIVPISRMTKSDGSTIDTMAFFRRLLALQPVPANLCGFFDSSAGSGKEPDAAPEIPEGYPAGPQQFVGFTGGIHAGNAKTWLDRYAVRAREHGCRLISDAQSGFRMDRSRGKPVDVAAVLELSLAVREWAAEAAKL